MTTDNELSSGAKSGCQIVGYAIAVWHSDGDITWERADPEVHITTELVSDATSYPTVFLKYAVKEWCEPRQAYHAKLRRETSETDRSIRLDEEKANHHGK